MSPPTHRPACPGELFRALAVLAEPPEPEHAAVAEALNLGPLPSRAAHTDLFDFQLFPYASVYLGPQGMQGGEPRDRIAGFWRVLEVEPPPEPDHLSVLLAACGALLDRSAEASGSEAAHWHRVARVFLHEHLLSWLPLFLVKLGDAGPGYYRRWAGRVRDLLGTQDLGASAEVLPAALRGVPSLPDPRREGGEAFLTGLLAPARTGFILTREDLARVARGCGLGRRAGERRFVLEQLLGQAPRAVLSALAALAADAARRDLRPMPPPTVNWWSRRARQSARLVDLLAREAP